MRQTRKLIVASILHPRQQISTWLGDALFRRLLHNAGWLLSGSSIATGLGLLSTILKTQALGPELFGLYAVILAYVAIIGRLCSFQPWQALIKYGAEALEQDRPQEFMGLVKLGLLLDGLSAVTGTSLAIAGAYVLAGWMEWSAAVSQMAALFSVSLLFRWSGTPTGVLRILDRFRLFTFQHIAVSVIGLTGVAIVFFSGGGIWEFLLVALIVEIVGGIVLLLLGFMALKEQRLFSHWQAPITNWQNFIQFSGWTYLSATLDIPVKQLDILIVSAVISLEATGIYKIIKQTVQLLSLLADPVYQAVYPQFAKMLVAGQAIDAARYAAKTGYAIFAFVGPVGLLVAATSYWWLDFIFGAGFSAGWVALSLFLIFKTLSLACIAVHPLFTAMGFVKKNVSILIFSNTVYVVLAYLLGRQFDLIGFSLAYGCAFLIVSGAKAAIIYKNL